MLEALTQSAVLRELPEEARAQLLAAGEQVRFAPGEVVLVEGGQARAMYVVLEGELDVVKRSGFGEVLLNTCGPGDLLGELALIHGGGHSATVRTRTSAELLSIDRATLARLLHTPAVAMALLESVTRRLEERELQMRQHDRMAALGTFTAGLLHELNNPAAAVVRGVDRLRDAIGSWLDLDAPDEREQRRALRELVADRRRPGDPLARADAEERVRACLEAAGIERPWELAAALADTGLTDEEVSRILADGGLADLRWLAARSTIWRLLEETALGASRISEIVAAVKRYAHVDEAAEQDVQVHAGLEAALTLLAHKLTPDVRVVRDYDSRLPTVPGNPGELNAVWTNLLDNAIDAVEGAGTITLRTRHTADDVVVEIDDTGPTVPPHVLDRVFDPFFTTKPVGRGTGLGLATALSVVARRHHGTLTLTSAEGHTVARVSLPRDTRR